MCTSYCFVLQENWTSFIMALHVIFIVRLFKSTFYKHLCHHHLCELCSVNFSFWYDMFDLITNMKLLWARTFWSILQDSIRSRIAISWRVGQTSSKYLSFTNIYHIASMDHNQHWMHWHMQGVCISPHRNVIILSLIICFCAFSICVCTHTCK